MEKEDVNCIFIDTGQHAGSLPDLFQTLELKKPEFYLSSRKSNVSTFPQSILWTLEIFIKFIFKRTPFQHKDAYCVSHADNLTAMYGTILAKLSGLKTVHLEAGERTSTLFKPFPEEFVRRSLDYISTMNITMSDISYQNLLEEKNNSININVSHSCAVDAMRTAIELKGKVDDLPDKYAVASAHRIETIYNKDRLEIIVNTLIKVSQIMKVIFVVHDNTKAQLKKYKFWDKLNNDNIEKKSVINYVQFAQILSGAQFVFTDGGGLQDETYFVGVPCLVMMDETGKDPHPNVCLSKLSDEIIDAFINNYNDYRTKNLLYAHNPSKDIVERLISL